MRYTHLKDLYKTEGDKVDINFYWKLRDEKLVKICKHPTLPLSILNYSARVNYDKKKWIKELLIARGLVIDDNGNIIARPFPKFFNEYEITGKLPSQEFEVYEKMDGSLIIMSFFNGRPFFCTRGSFTSEQALKAEEIYLSRYKNVEINQEYTYCFEIIYPENRIVVDYKGAEDVFLLAKIHTKSGKETKIDDCGFSNVKRVDGITTIEEMKKVDTQNQEGFVVRFIDDNFRMKIKFKSYVNLHKFGYLSYEKVLKFLKKGEELPIENVPDEAYDEIKLMVKNIRNQYKNIEETCKTEYEIIMKDAREEAEIIRKIKTSSNRSILFAMHRGKNCENLIWK